MIPCLPSRNPVERRGSRTIEQSTRNDDLATSGLIEIGSLRRRLAAARGADRAASALLSERLSDAKRLAAAVARGSQPASIEEPAVQPAPEPEGESLKLWIDVPQIAGDRLSQSIRGSFLIEGWAIARDGVASIEISIDGKHFGDAKYGLRREDVGEGHPGWENAAFSGFAMVVPRTAVAGEHSVRVEVRSRNGHSKAIDFAIKAGDVSEEGSLWLPRRKMPRAEIDVTENVLSGLGHHPLFGILLSVADPDDEASLEATLQSLREQAYDRWRALIVTEGLVKRAQLASRLTSWSPELTGRVSIAAADATGDLADGLADMAGAERPDLVAMVAAGDILGCDALLQMAVSSGLHTAAEFLYADERRISPITGKLEAFLKPQWSPDLLLATNYIGRLWCAKSSLLNRIGARLEEWQRFGEYDLVLRCTEAAQRIHHVPKVLCQRGTLQIDSPAREREALARAMDRRGIDGELGQGCAPGYYTLRRRSNNRGLVSIIMPTGGNVALIGKCLPGLFERTANQNFELIILYNTSTKLEVFPYLEAIASDPRVRIIDSKGSFNFSRICNLGAAASRGEFLLFLNDDIEVIEPDWMDGLIQHAERPEVGAVGARLLYPDRTVQHGGIFWIAGTLGGRHSFRHLPDAEPGYFGLAVTPRNVLAVTGACIMMRRNWFEKIGGFDESHTVINNDVDLCLRCWSHGGLVVYEPAVTLIHHELATRHDMPDEYDTQGFWEKWGPLLKAGDPYYHPNLSRRANDYSADEEPLQRLYAGHPLFRREEIQRILVSKLDHIGDFITAVPALKRLHGLFPEAELYLLAPPATAALAGLVPDIKEVINFEFFHTRSALGERELSEEDLIALQCRLAPYHFDLGVDLRKHLDARKVLRFTGARWLAGYDRDGRFPWLDIAPEWEGDNRLTSKRSHVGDDLCRLVEAIAVASRRERTILRLSEPARTDAPSGFPWNAKRYVCVHPGVGTKTRQWPVEHFAALIDLLVLNHDVAIALIGGDDEVEVAANVLERVVHKEAVRSLAGRTKLKDLPGLLAAAALFVGNNSGPKHIAAGLGVPTISIESGVVDSNEWGPIGPNAVAMRRNMWCSPCYIATADQCPRGLACLTDLQPSAVYEVCKEMLVVRPLLLP